MIRSRRAAVIPGPATQGLFGARHAMIPRYSRPEMVKIWEPENRFRIWLEIEAHA
jgi:hypothetical protein